MTEAIWAWGIGVIRALQPHDAPALDAAFQLVTALGSGVFYLLFFPLLLWCVDYRVGARLALLFFVSGWLNFGLKSAFQHPRPFELDPSLQRVSTRGYGLPSGHAQNAVVIWGSLGREARRPAARLAAIAAILLIGLSRVYLGVHFPTDVIAGWGIGAALLAAAVGFGPRIERRLRHRFAAQLGISVGVPLVALWLYPGAESASFAGLVMGVGVGVACNARLVDFHVPAPPRTLAARYVLGLPPLVALYAGAGALAPDGPPGFTGLALTSALYAGLGLWLALGACVLFRCLGLEEGRR